MSTSKLPPAVGSSEACCPIHRTMAAGSVRCRKTSSTGAGSSTSVSYWSSVMLTGLLGQRLPELAQVASPEVGQELLDGAEAVGVDDEQMTRALVALVDQPGLTQHLEMPGNGLAGDVEMARDIADGAGVTSDELEYRAPV